MTCERTLIHARPTSWIAPQNLQFTLWNSGLWDECLWDNGKMTFCILIRMKWNCRCDYGRILVLMISKFGICKVRQFIVVLRTYVCYTISSATIHGRRLVLTPEDGDLWLHRNLLAEILRMEDLLMLTTDLFIAIISLCITCFALGYTVGSKSNDKTQK